MDNKERTLNRIQKHHNLNEVVSMDEEGPGGAHHSYRVYHGLVSNGETPTHTDIIFQKGPRTVTTSVSGVLDGDLLEMVRDRLQAFQNGPYACKENANALLHLEEALLWMNARAEERASRDVLGTTKI